MVGLLIFLSEAQDVKNNYSDSEIDSAQQYFRKLSRIQIDELTAAILLGFPGSLECYRLSELARNIDEYREIDTNALRSNLGEFIQAIFPTAQQTGIRLAIHTDDPPFDYLGLPRVVSNKQI
jgi:mannonate dehydratase